jgi:hypothetical protein
LYEPIPLFVFELRNPIFQKIGFLKPRFLVKNPTIFIHYFAFLNSKRRASLPLSEALESKPLDLEVFDI